VDCTDLQPQMQHALALLAEGRTPAEVASEIGVARQTLWRWRQVPEFAAAFAEAQRARVDEARASCVAAATDAIGVLASIMSDAEQPGAVRVRAAVALLNQCGLNARVDPQDPTPPRVEFITMPAEPAAGRAFMKQLSEQARTRTHGS
jgi:hypothetical protein